MQIDIPRISGQPLQVDLNHGDRLFIVGANGAGKSALLHRFVSSFPNVRRISAHRQTWLYSGAINLTPQNRKQIFQQIKASEIQDEARWKDQFAGEKQMAALFDLVAHDNATTRSTYFNFSKVVSLGDNEVLKFASEFTKKSNLLFEKLNELLALGTFTVSLENSKGEEIFAKHKKNGARFSIAQMSDGERNAVLLAAEVLTVEPSTILLIDEPERHLHRAINEPFLSALFKMRKDCIFIVSTHETTLPAIDSEARTLILRSCKWVGNKANTWDAELLQANTDLPEDLKRAILGARKKILFVEGTNNSLDQQIYNALFPDTLIVSKGSCGGVEKAVKGLQDTHTIHNTDVFGLIDRDNRNEQEIKELFKKNIFALDVCSVEALYYCLDTIKVVAHQQAEFQGFNADEIIKEVQEEALNALKESNLAERMVARRCTRQVHNKVLSKLPDWKWIKDNQVLNTKIDIISLYNTELEYFKKLVGENKLDELFGRYPIRESSVFNKIAEVLRFQNRKHYEQAVITQIIKNDKLAQTLKNHIHPLSEALETKPVPPTVS